MLEPTQLTDFLGFTVDSVGQELHLPADKIKKKKIRAGAWKLGDAISTVARKLSQFLGKLNATTRVVPVAPLFYRNLQAALGRALEMGDQDYSVSVQITPSMREKLQWWGDHLSQWNGKTLVMEKPSIITETDASDWSWGATSQGLRTGGPWSKTESKLHINCLEALAAFVAVKCFVWDHRSVAVLLRMDNTSTVTMGHSVTETDSHNKGFVILVSAERHNTYS